MKFNVSQVAHAMPMTGNRTIFQYMDRLPYVGAGRDLNELVSSVLNAKVAGKPVILAFGGHVIKQGLGPIVADLVRRHIVTHLAVTGAVPIHDYELAITGETSHDIQADLPKGLYKASSESVSLLNAALVQDVTLGLGGAIIKVLGDGLTPVSYSKSGSLSGATVSTRTSALYAALWHRCPMTVHTAIGADLVHEYCHDGAALGAMLMRDFYRFREVITQMDHGGVFICFGSAVVIPEVFLKAVASSQRDFNGKPHAFTTAVFDFIKHYRPVENIVNRPTHDNDSQGFHFVGHHEIMLPLLAAAILEKGSF